MYRTLDPAKIIETLEQLERTTYARLVRKGGGDVAAGGVASVLVHTPVRSPESSDWWPGRMPKSPDAPGAMTPCTSPENLMPTGVTISHFMGVSGTKEPVGR